GRPQICKVYASLKTFLVWGAGGSCGRRSLARCYVHVIRTGLSRSVLLFQSIRAYHERCRWKSGRAIILFSSTSRLLCSLVSFGPFCCCIKYTRKYIWSIQITNSADLSFSGLRRLFLGC